MVVGGRRRCMDSGTLSLWQLTKHKPSASCLKNRRCLLMRIQAHATHLGCCLDPRLFILLKNFKAMKILVVMDKIKFFMRELCDSEK